MRWYSKLLGLALALSVSALAAQTLGPPSGGSSGSGPIPAINVASCLSAAQLTAVQSGGNTTDVTACINSSIATCNTAARCKLYFPAGYYYSSTCNLTALTAAVTVQGDGTRSLDGTQIVSTVACGTNAVPLFTVNSLIGLFRDIGLLSTGFTPASGSSAIIVNNGASNNLQEVNYENIQVDGFYDSVDVRVGNSWHLMYSVLQNCVHWCVRVQNTVLADAGDWSIAYNNIYPASAALAGVRMESSGGAKIVHNQIVANSGTIVDCINVDTTGHNSEQIEISGNKCESSTGIPINVVRGWSLMKINDNTLKSSVAGVVNPAIFCSTCTNTIIQGNALQGSGNAITLVSANLLTIGCNQSNFHSLLLNTTPTGNVNVSTACNLSPTFYQGPGDIKAGAAAWWGLRAYSLAKAGTPAANICNAGDANCADINTLSNGTFDVLTARSSPLFCGAAGGTCTVKILYDQSGSTNCAAAACHLTNNTAALRPVLTFNCQSGLACMTTSSATGISTSSANSSIAQPFTLVGMGQRTGNFTVYNTLLSNAAGSVGLYYHTTGNADFIVNLVDHDFAASNSAWHALQAIGNGASSSGTSDGTTTAISAAATAFTSAALIRAFNDTAPPGDAFIGTTTEFGIWPVAFSTTELALMNSNMHAFWSF